MSLIKHGNGLVKKCVCGCVDRSCSPCPSQTGLEEKNHSVFCEGMTENTLKSLKATVYLKGTVAV